MNEKPKTPSLWRQILRQNFTQWETFADYLELDPAQRQEILQHPHFVLNVPMRLAKKMAKGTLDDPLLRQFLPTKREEEELPGFVVDPVGDQACRKGPKLLHKYNGRALLVCTSACAMHCRYCFRQNFDYDTAPQLFKKELETISLDTSLQEIILSGGDPLSLSNSNLNELLIKLSNIPHVKRIRFHTRFPIGIPERIDEQFLQILDDVTAQLWFVIHVNHPSELDVEVLAHLKLLQKRGITLLNQSVLLKGVNDDVHILKELCEKLVDNGIIPYYLHQLDRVKGAAHFEVDEAQGRLFIQELLRQLPGYAVPKYVCEIPGEPSKTILG